MRTAAASPQHEVATLQHEAAVGVAAADEVARDIRKERKVKVVEGVALELEDCAFGLLDGLELSDDPDAAFSDANWALLVGSKPRGPGMERGDLIRENGPIFVSRATRSRRPRPTSGCWL